MTSRLVAKADFAEIYTYQDDTDIVARPFWYCPAWQGTA